MRARIIAFLVISVALLGLNHGLSQIKPATAQGVPSVSIVSATCSGGTTDVTVSWPTLNQGQQFIYWSLQNNGFQAGTYTALGPLAASATTAMVQDLPLNATIYIMVGTVMGGGVEPGTTMVFSTSGICQSMAPSGPSTGGHHSGGHSPFEACGFPFGHQGFDPSMGPIPHQFTPFDHLPFTHDFDDEDDEIFDFDEDDEDEDEDEHDFDEDEDDDDESDGDESDEDESDEDEADEDEGDEDESDDEDEDDEDFNFLGNPNFFDPCLLFGAHGFGGHGFGGHGQIHPAIFGSNILF